MSDNRAYRDRKGFSQDQLALLEPLESRLLMSGDVLVKVVHGSLVIRGDSASNHIAISQNGGQFLVTGQDGTTINGGLIPIGGWIGVTRDVIIRLGDGMDVVDVTGIAVPRHLVIRGGHSGDTFNITDGSVGRNVSVKACEGDNTTSIDGTIVGGRVTASGGRGVDVLNLTDDASVVGRVTFQPSRGESRCSINLSTMGSLRVVTYGGPADIDVTQSSIQGKTTIATGNSADSVSLDYSIFGGTLTLNMSSGEDRVLVENSTFSDTTVVKTGQGNDLVVIEDESSGGLGTVFSGTARIQLGSGDDRILIDHFNLGDPVTFGSALVDGGRGFDRYVIGDETNWTGDSNHRLVSITDGSDDNDILL